MRSKKPSLQTYVSEETKAKFAAAAMRYGCANEAQFLRVMVDRVLGEEQPAPPKPSLVERAKRAQVNIGLTPDENHRVAELAAKQGVNRTTWIVNLIRAQTLREQQFSPAELDALMESNRQLAAVGRNLNQIARNLNLDLNASRSVTVEAIETIASEIKQHRRRVSALMDANLNRWGIES
ncbi:plasmid mobilization relaxosome protein MobC [Paraburkholderia sp. SIMBA_009]